MTFLTAQHPSAIPCGRRHKEALSSGLASLGSSSIIRNAISSPAFLGTDPAGDPELIEKPASRGLAAVSRRRILCSCDREFPRHGIQENLILPFTRRAN